MSYDLSSLRFLDTASSRNTGHIESYQLWIRFHWFVSACQCWLVLIWALSTYWFTFRCKWLYHNLWATSKEHDKCLDTGIHVCVSLCVFVHACVCVCAFVYTPSYIHIIKGHNYVLCETDFKTLISAMVMVYIVITTCFLLFFNLLQLFLLPGFEAWNAQRSRKRKLLCTILRNVLELTSFPCSSSGKFKKTLTCDIEN